VRLVAGPEDSRASVEARSSSPRRPPPNGRSFSPSPQPSSPTAAPSPRTPHSLRASTGSRRSSAPATQRRDSTPANSSPSTARQEQCCRTSREDCAPHATPGCRSCDHAGAPGGSSCAVASRAPASSPA
jgi:hypothetical protein